MEFSAKQIAEYIHGEIVGNENATVHTFAKIEEGVPGAIPFLSCQTRNIHITFIRPNRLSCWSTEISNPSNR